jgi:16S rRNA processing protein RimM
VTSDKKDPGHSSLDTHHSSLLLVGVVGRPHGLAGEIKIDPTTTFPERFTPGLRVVWTRADQQRTLTIRAARPHGNRVLLSFVGIDDRDAARALVNGELSVGADEAFPAPEGFHYSHELAGLPCEDRQGRLLGHAVKLENTPAGPLLEIDTLERQEVLIPFVAGIVWVDRANKKIVLDPPEGLLDLE